MGQQLVGQPGPASPSIACRHNGVMAFAMRAGSRAPEVTSPDCSAITYDRSANCSATHEMGAADVASSTAGAADAWEANQQVSARSAPARRGTDAGHGAIEMASITRTRALVRPRWLPGQGGDGDGARSGRRLEEAREQVGVMRRRLARRVG